MLIHRRRFSKLIKIYLKFCEDCELKKSRIRKSIVVKPILEKDFNERMQVDLIDMQAQKSGEFSWIFNAQVRILFNFPLTLPS